MFIRPFLKKEFLSLLFISWGFGGLRCQDLNSGTIADSLKRGAVAVKRMDETEIEIESPRKAKLHYKYFYTILNSSGDPFATVHSFYDKFHKLNNVTAILYDSEGRELKKIRKNEMEDWSAEGSGTLMTDTRIKFFRFSSRSYPYSISYEEETELDGLFVLPQWLPQSSPGLAIEDCKLIVKFPLDYSLHYKEYHFPTDPAVTEEHRNKIYTWELRNMAAHPSEPFSPSWLHLEPCIKLAPGNFEIQGYKGNLLSWKDMGDFINTLWEGRDKLPEEAKKKVHALTDGLKNDQDKINVLYDFLQKNSHYVGIQFGIGGWQPFDASYVYYNRYGECKALSNFMVALLKEAGISSCVVLIKAGSVDPDIDSSFVSSQFNHVIVLAMAGNDSVWLECTSQTIPPGYLGSFTDDRYALLINKSGGVIVRTPVYGLNENQFSRTLNGSIDSMGNLNAILKSHYSGLEQDGLEGMINRFTKKELWDQRQQTMGLNNCTITDFILQQSKGKIPAIDETILLKSENFANVSGKRIFIDPGPFLKKAAQIPEGNQPRRSEIELSSSFQETDSLLLRIPPGYTAEKPLVSRHFSSSFGNYEFHTELRGDSLLITCRYRQFKGQYPAASFSKLVQFFNLIHRESTTELVMVKKQE